MTSLVPGAYVVKNIALIFSTTQDFSVQVRKARLVPETNIVTYKTAVPGGVYVFVDNPTWTLEIEGVQDWVEAEGLARYLHDHHGEVAQVSLAPNVGGTGPTATFEVVCMTVPFGGTEGAVPDLDITLPVVGEPEFTD